MENRYQSRLRRNQVKIVKEIAAKVQEVNQDAIREFIFGCSIISLCIGAPSVFSISSKCFSSFAATNVSYIHRIGRTGRAGGSGLAITFVAAKDEKHLEEIHQVHELLHPLRLSTEF
jgi:hypothetical protein